MIIRYPASGNGDVFILDTESQDVRQVCEWAAGILKASSWTIGLDVAAYDFGVPDTAQPGGTIVFTSASLRLHGLPVNPTGETSANIGLREMIKSPENITRALALLYNVAGIDLDKLKYTDPDTPQPGQEDWQVPGALIGPPLASKPGCFQYKLGGQLIGHKYTGASGAVYVLTEYGSMFSRITAWKKE
jgi:hypothetical protein